MDKQQESASAPQRDSFPGLGYLILLPELKEKLDNLLAALERHEAARITALLHLEEEKKFRQ